MKKALLLSIFSLSVVVSAMAQQEIYGNAGSSEEQMQAPLNASGSTPESNNPDNNSNPNDAQTDTINSDKRILDGGGHVTVQDILGVDDADSFTHLSPLDGISQSSGSGNPVSATTPSANQPTQQNNTSGVKGTVHLYPNPSSDETNVITEGEIIFGVIDIIDVTGKLVKKIVPNSGGLNGSTASFTVRDLKSGIYLLRFQTDKNWYVKRLQVR